MYAHAKVAALVLIAGALFVTQVSGQSQSLSVEMSQYFSSLGLTIEMATMGDRMFLSQRDYDPKQSAQYRLAFALEVMQAYLKKNDLTLAKLNIGTVHFSSFEKAGAKLAQRDDVSIQALFLDDYFKLPPKKKLDALWKGVWQPLLEKGQ